MFNFILFKFKCLIDITAGTGMTAHTGIVFIIAGAGIVTVIENPAGITVMGAIVCFAVTAVTVHISNPVITGIASVIAEIDTGAVSGKTAIQAIIDIISMKEILSVIAMTAHTDMTVNNAIAATL